MNYAGFLGIVFGIAVVCIAVVLVTYRRGDRITRDALEDETSD